MSQIWPTGQRLGDPLPRVSRPHPSGVGGGPPPPAPHTWNGGGGLPFSLPPKCHWFCLK